MARKTYSNDDREAALATLQANGGNVTRTSQQTSIDRKTLRDWRDGGEIIPPPEKAIALGESFLEKIKRAREVALDRMLEIMPLELDLHKIAGAAKLLHEMGLTQEVINVRLADSSGSHDREPRTIPAGAFSSSHAA